MRQLNPPIFLAHRAISIARAVFLITIVAGVACFAARGVYTSRAARKVAVTTAVTAASSSLKPTRPSAAANVLSAITVNTTSDVANGSDGFCTLREAITAANNDAASGATPGECAAGSGDDTISFTVTGTITLLTSLPGVSSNLSINGPGSNLLTIARSSTGGTPQFRVFELNAVVNISGVTVTNGATSVSSPAGGGILNFQTLTLTDVIVSGNTTTEGSPGGGVGGGGGNGGGIYNSSGTLTMTSCVVSGNTAGQGGAAAGWGGPGGSGGGIHNDATLIMTDCSVTGNNAGKGGSGVAGGGNGGPGGGIYNQFGANANVSMTNCTVSGNNAGSSGDGGGHTNGAHGGGIATFGGITTLTGVTLTNNSAGDSADTGVGGNGGGIHIDGQAGVTLINSTVNGNQSGSSTSGLPGWGGGISNHVALTVTGSTINNNTTESVGGGIANRMSSAVLIITNSTVSGNQASGSGAGIYDDAAVMKMTNCTVTNHSSIGFSTSGSHTRTVRNSIIAGNGTDLEGSFTSQGNNLIGKSDGTNGFTNGSNGDQVGTLATPLDPRLGLLATNGGPTQTHALLAESAAIDAGNNCVFNDSCSPALGVSLTTDQRGAGFNRSIDGNGDGTATVDIGAYEVQSILVTNTADSGAGSLRQAITDANVGADTNAINFQAGLTGTITLLTALPELSTSISIHGPGANQMIVQRSTAGGTPDFRIFRVNSGSTVSISGLTISNGRTNNNGAGIANYGNLTILNCTISGNSEVTSGWGGGIYNDTLATLNVTNSTISGNSAPDAGGIGNTGVLTVTNSTVSGNSASGSSGGIWSYSDSTLTVTNSTISGNIAGDAGGGIQSLGAATLTNTTISGNTAGGSGGGLARNGPTASATLTNVTITNNHCSTNGGGALLNAGEDKLRNTIVAGNFFGPGTSTPDDISGTVDTTAASFNNSIGTGGTGGLTAINGNQISVANPGLGALANNGGPTQTHALLADSTAIDAGNNCVLTDSCSPPALGVSLTTDQRGAGFARSTDGNGDGTATVDIGAYEVGIILVTNTADSGPGSLRQAITDANANADTNAINFQPGLTGTISLLTEMPLLATSMKLNGPGANLITVARNNGAAGNFCIFTIYSGPSNQNVWVMISGLTMSGGTAGGIQNLGTLTINNSAIINNTSTGGGAGITNGFGGSFVSLILNNSIVSNNSAVQSGGGINNGAPLTIINCTISGNRSDLHGGGITTGSDTLTIINSTITNNRSDFNNDTFGAGGGMSQSGGGTRILRNTIVAGNFKGTGSDVSDVDLALSPTSSFNLIGDGTGMTGITNGSNGNQVGTFGAPIDPKLGSLANNGGATQTHALLPSSPALNAGSNTLATNAGLTTDQRGFARIANTTVDIGSFESRGFTIAATSGTPQSAPITTAFGSSLVATVSSAFGEPVAGGVVIFTAPPSGVSGTFPGSVTTVNASINASGLATAPTFTANAIVGGPYNVVASLAGGSPSANFSLINLKGNQTITVNTHAPASASYNSQFTVAATASSGLAVTYSSSGACTNVGATFTMTSGTGTCTVKYDQGGSSNYNAAPQVTESVTAQKANQTITVNTHAPASASYNSQFTVAATASSGLAVIYSSSGTCTNVGATFTMTSGTGTCTVKYDQGGSSNYNAAPQVTESVTAQKANQTITVNTHAPASASYNSQFTVAATASSGLAVIYSSSGTCTNVGATFTMTSGTGTCTVKYDQGGSSNYNAAPQVTESVTAQKANQTITVNTHAPASASYNSQFTVAATASSGLAVTYSSSGACTNSGATFTMTSGTGTCTVKYDQGGSSNYNAAPQVTESVTAQKANQTITFNALVGKTFGNADFNVSATATSSLAVSFTASGQCTISGTLVHITGAGSCTITAKQTGNDNYSSAPEVPRAFTIATAATTTAVSSSVNPSEFGQSVTFTATVSSGAGIPTGTVQFKDGAANIASGTLIAGVAQVTTSSLTSGLHTITAIYSGDGNFAISVGTLAGGQTVASQRTLSISDVSIAEGNSGTANLVFTVTLSAASNLTVNVDYSTSNGTATTVDGDYQSAANTTITFNPGNLSKTVTVLVNGDQKFEPDETLFVNLTNPVNAAISDTQGVGTILNDDSLQLILDASGPDANQLLALESMLFTRDPFRVRRIAEWLNLGADQNTRVIVFAANLQLNQGETAAAVAINLIDGNGQSHNVTAEHVVPLPNSPFTQVVFRLPDLSVGTCQVTISAHGQTTNTGTFRIVQ